MVSGNNKVSACVSKLQEAAAKAPSGSNGLATKYYIMATAAIKLKELETSSFAFVGYAGYSYIL